LLILERLVSRVLATKLIGIWFGLAAANYVTMKLALKKVK